jgi:ribosomal protein S18 acetylase RimI-like enzyme
VERTELLRTLDGYLDTAPRVASRVETLGPFTVFAGTGPWPYYARPTPGRGLAVGTDDVVAVCARQRELRTAVAFEWVVELAPGLGEAVAAAGLEWNAMPLLVLEQAVAAVPVPGVSTRVLTADDPALPAAVAAIDVGFGTPGTAPGPGDVAERDAALAATRDGLEFRRGLIRDGHMVWVVAETAEGPIAGGAAVPRGAVAELTGIATLPAWRRRGVGAMVTAALTQAAAAVGAETVFLSASDDAVARVYERAGFRRVASVGEAAQASRR